VLDDSLPSWLLALRVALKHMKKRLSYLFFRTGYFYTSLVLIQTLDGKAVNIGKVEVGRVGFEPTTNWLKASCSTD
jgi:hypothetical protein